MLFTRTARGKAQHRRVSALGHCVRAVRVDSHPHPGEGPHGVRLFPQFRQWLLSYLSDLAINQAQG